MSEDVYIVETVFNKNDIGRILNRYAATHRYCDIKTYGADNFIIIMEKKEPMIAGTLLQKENSTSDKNQLGAVAEGARGVGKPKLPTKRQKQGDTPTVRSNRGVRGTMSLPPETKTGD